MSPAWPTSSAAAAMSAPRDFRSTARWRRRRKKFWRECAPSWELAEDPKARYERSLAELRSGFRLAAQTPPKRLKLQAASSQRPATRQIRFPSARNREKRIQLNG